MKEKELRIGNVVTLLDKQVSVVAMTQDTISVDGYEFNRYTPVALDYRGLQGIELTEEILLKCGAIRVSHKVFKNYFKLHLKRNKYLVISDVETPNLMVGIIECHFENGQIEDVINVHNWDFEKDMHLHQLQNLYFALTGEELEVKI